MGPYVGAPARRSSVTSLRGVSEQSQGPGWWMAADGRWYPPETHPGYRPPPPVGAPLGRRPELEPLNTPIIVGLCSAAAIALGCFLPWAGSRSGMELDDGTFFLVGAALLAVATWLRWHAAWVWAIGGIELLATIYEVTRIATDDDGRLGYGIVVVGAAAVAAVMAGFQLRDLRST